MMYAKIEPLIIGLPTSGQLADGRWVSNYHLLPEDVLLKEGWLPADEAKPIIAENQTLELDTVVQDKGQIVIAYKAAIMPISQLAAAEAELDKYKAAVADIAKINLTTALKTEIVAAISKLITAVKPVAVVVTKTI
jgi:hypothetical protein